eukprot:TRINITY_DN1000_c0_g1_i1.p1 TRINITY_DN1000_c0_g1~~TRINITY_DN1000_c0_g1_i1.p1  ORF type:complete len:211 (-),score=48.14 TRINITY_DN1000_c0_g1_i1:19-651(-)
MYYTLPFGSTTNNNIPSPFDFIQKDNQNVFLPSFLTAPSFEVPRYLYDPLVHLYNYPLSSVPSAPSPQQFNNFEVINLDDQHPGINNNSFKEYPDSSPISSDFSPSLPSTPIEFAHSNDKVNSPSKSDKKNKKKRTRFFWDELLSSHFHRAMSELGTNATARKVLDLMEANGADVSSLSRVRVANHMQHISSRENRMMVEKMKGEEFVNK